MRTLSLLVSVILMMLVAADAWAQRLYQLSIGFDERGRSTQIVSLSAPGLIRFFPATPPTFALSVR